MALLDGVSDCVVAKYLFSATTAIVHVAASYKVVLKKEKLAAPERRWLVPNKSTRCSTVTCVSGAYPPEVRYALGGGCTYGCVITLWSTTPQAAPKVCI